MSEDIVYEVEAHTRAKHAILGEYLKAWAPILARGFPGRRLLYVDGFAGAGEHANAPGSPQIALQTLSHALEGIPSEVDVVFIERDAKRVEYLTRVVREEQIALAANHLRVRAPVIGDCATIVSEIVSDHERSGHQLGPAFFFLDQFGYANVPMSLLTRILKHSSCETFSYLNWMRLGPYLTDPIKEDSIRRAFGGDEWKDAIPLSGRARIETFKKAYISALKQRGGARYVYDFAMHDDTNRIIYWLFFATNSIDGLEKMKKAMWKVDPSGRFQFSDKDDADGYTAMYPYTAQQLADDLHKEFVGREITREALHLHVLEQTPEYRWAEAIKILRDGKKVAENRGDNGERSFRFVEPPAGFIGDQISMF